MLAVLMVVGTLLRMYSFSGMWGTDDAEYSRLAHALSVGQYDEFIQRNYVDDRDTPAHWPGRIGNYYPLSVIFRVVGIREMAPMVYPLVISVLGILLAYCCGRLLFGVSAGLIGAAIWVFLPLDVRFATFPLPDIPASFWASLGVAVVLFRLYGERPWPANPWLAGVAAGLCFGISWLTKESIAYLVPFVAGLMVVSIRRNPRAELPFWTAVALTSLVVLAGELTAYQLWRGDFLHRVHENEKSYVQSREFLFYEGSRFGWPAGTSRFAAVLKRIFVTGPETIFLESASLFLPSLGALAAVYAAYWKDKAFVAPALWMFSLILAYNFATVSFSSYTPLVLSNTRYLHPILLPAVLLTAGLLAKLLTGQQGVERSLAKERFIWGAALVALVGVTAAYMTFRGVRDQGLRTAYDATKEVTRIVRPTDPLYTDPLTAKALEFHWKYPDAMSVKDFEEMTPADVPSGSFVLIDRQRLNWLRINVGSYWLTRKYAYQGPRFDPVPAGWKRVWSNSNAALYRVGAHSR
jgi:hypothetical protein